MNQRGILIVVQTHRLQESCVCIHQIPGAVTDLVCQIDQVSNLLGILINQCLLDLCHISQSLLYRELLGLGCQQFFQCLPVNNVLSVYKLQIIQELQPLRRKLLEGIYRHCAVLVDLINHGRETIEAGLNAVNLILQCIDVQFVHLLKDIIQI